MTRKLQDCLLAFAAILVGCLIVWWCLTGMYELQAQSGLLERAVNALERIANEEERQRQEREANR